MYLRTDCLNSFLERYREIQRGYNGGVAGGFKFIWEDGGVGKRVAVAVFLMSAAMVLILFLLQVGVVFQLGIQIIAPSSAQSGSKDLVRAGLLLLFCVALAASGAYLTSGKDKELETSKQKRMKERDEKVLSLLREFEFCGFDKASFLHDWAREKRDDVWAEYIRLSGNLYACFIAVTVTPACNMVIALLATDFDWVFKCASSILCVAVAMLSVLVGGIVNLAVRRHSEVKFFSDLADTIASVMISGPAPGGTFSEDDLLGCNPK